MVDRPHTRSLPELDSYLEDTLRQMGRNRDVKTDATGEPIYDVKAAGRTAEGAFRIDFTADMSGIGMPTNSPLAVIAGGGGPLAWFLGHVLIATTPREHPPERAADALGMDALLNAHRKWITGSSQHKSR